MTTCNPADLESFVEDARRLCKMKEDNSAKTVPYLRMLGQLCSLLAVNMCVFFFIPCNSPGTEEMSLIERGVP